MYLILILGKNWCICIVLLFQKNNFFLRQSFVGLADGKRKGADKNRAINFELTEKMVTTQVPEQEQETDTKQEDKKTSKDDTEKMEEVCCYIL